MNWLRKLSLMKQIAILIMIMLTVLMISFIISNHIAERIIEKKVSKSVDNILLQANEKMTSFFKDLNGISSYLLYSPPVQNILSTNDDLSVILMNNEVTSMFSNTMSLKESIRGIQLYNAEGKMVAGIGVGLGKAEVTPVQRVEYSGILQNIGGNKNTVPYYTFSVPVYNLKSNILRDFRGTCVFVMDMSNYHDILVKAKITAHSSLVLLDQHQKIIANDGSAPISGIFDINKYSRKDNLIQTISLSQNGWELISIIPKDELLNEMDIIRRLNIGTYLVMIGILSFFFTIFFTRIMKPIKALVDFMRSYPKKGGNIRFPFVYHNEVGVLAANLNKMLDEIDLLGKEVQVSQKRMFEIELMKKQMEISAFRNQINPHFLYNTLECIRAMALYHDVSDIADITSSLSNIYRYSVKGNDFVTIQEEIYHIQEYAKIIEFRFMGKITIGIEMEEDLGSTETLKMMLQPIVENAVFHGLETKLDHGHVQINIRKVNASQVLFQIRDNGCGMEEFQVKQLMDRMALEDAFRLSNKEISHGIGLLNIYRRIKLIYGDRANLTIESQKGVGTVVSIVLSPMLEAV